MIEEKELKSKERQCYNCLLQKKPVTFRINTKDGNEAKESCKKQSYQTTAGVSTGERRQSTKRC